MTSWIAGADGSDFGLENLPLGIFSTADRPRPGVAIGDAIVDLSMLIRERLVDDETLLDAPTLNPFLGHGRGAWRALRTTLQRLLGDAAGTEERSIVQRALVPRHAATMHLPIEVRDFVDFYSGIEHATNAGRLMRPTGDPLLPNYRHLPVGYHSRAASVVVSGTPVRRPHGQLKAPDADAPTFGPSRQLDIELELAFVAGSGNGAGAPIAVDRAAEHVYGFALLNDWSARDIQAWEYQPLGPFLAKSFATTLGAWIVSLDALEPFRVPQRPQDPEPLPHLRPQGAASYAIELEVLIRTASMRAAGAPPVTIARTNAAELYWTFAQQLAHLTSNGSRVRTGDLFGTGTISGSEPGTYGSLMELSWRGARPIVLPSGEQRSFLEDGDTIVLRARAAKDGFRVGFGEVSGTIEP